LRYCSQIPFGEFPKGEKEASAVMAIGGFKVYYLMTKVAKFLQRL
jgi:hypothetical protein